MRNLLRYLGLIRPYSLVDLLLLLFATSAPAERMFGAVLLWLGFLALLESSHQQSYRIKVETWWWLVPTLPGALLYGWPAALLFIGLGIMYTLKDSRGWGLISPFVRGLQALTLIGGLVGYTAPLALLAGGVMVVRNLLGDLRDVNKDRSHGILTIPVVLRVRGNHPNVHLLAVLVTSCLWWFMGQFSITYLFAAIAIEIATYRMTER